MIITLLTVTFDDDSVKSWCVKRFESSNEPGWIGFINEANEQIGINGNKIKFYKIEQIDQKE